MTSNLLIETENLKDLLLNPEMKIPDSTGKFKLIEKAQINSELNALSPQKKLQEDVVCNLVKDFEGFDQIAFSELDSYILISNFAQERILEEFKNYVYRQDIDEDLILKGMVARNVQHLERTAFSYSYIIERFEKLHNIEPWLYAELILACNWRKGIEFVTEQLVKNYDTSYLFSILPELMNKEDHKGDISEALSTWYPLLNEQDKKLANYYAYNFGYKITKVCEEISKKNKLTILNFNQEPGFVAFIENSKKPNYKTLIS